MTVDVDAVLGDELSSYQTVLGVGQAAFGDTTLTAPAAAGLALTVLGSSDDDPINTCLITQQTNKHEVASRMQALLDAELLNGHGTTKTGLVGDHRPGQSKVGLFEETDAPIVIDEAEHVSPNLQFLYEPLYDQQYTLTTGRTRKQIAVPHQIVALASPDGGVFSEYDPLFEQVPFRVRTILPFAHTVVSDHRKQVPNDASIPSIEMDIADLRAYRDQVAPICPTTTPEADDTLANPPQFDQSESIAVEDVYDLEVLARAVARLRKSETVTVADVEAVYRLFDYISVFPLSESDAPRLSLSDTLNTEMLDTGTSAPQRERIRCVKECITALEADYDNGVPFEDLADVMKQNGVDEEDLEATLAKLTRTGDAIEPRSDHWVILDA